MLHPNPLLDAEEGTSAFTPVRVSHSCGARLLCEPSVPHTSSVGMAGDLAVDGAFFDAAFRENSILHPNNWVSARPAGSQHVPRSKQLGSGDQRNRHVTTRIGTERESSDLPDNAEGAGSIPASPTLCPSSEAFRARGGGRAKPRPNSYPNMAYRHVLLKLTEMLDTIGVCDIRTGGSLNPRAPNRQYITSSGRSAGSVRVGKGTVGISWDASEFWLAQSHC